MSRTPASYSMPVVRGSTWEDVLDYYEDDETTPIDLTGYEGRMQVRTETGRFGTTTTETLLMELLTTGANPRLFIETPPGGTVPNRVRIRVEAEDTIDLNPENERKVKLAYGLELYQPAGVDPEYVLPLANGSISAKGEVAR